jgi:hypothetical protein
MVRIGGADLPDGVRVIDLAGRTVLVGRANDQGQLDLTELASGSYVLELQRGQILQRSYLIKH